MKIEAEGSVKERLANSGKCLRLATLSHAGNEFIVTANKKIKV